MSRNKDLHWNLESPPTTWEQVIVAVLMDLRDEMKEMNFTLGRIRDVVECENAIDIPKILRRIDVNTRRKRKPRVRKASLVKSG